MRGAWTAVLGLVVWACGGRLEADNSPIDAMPGVSPGVDSATPVADASTSDTSDEIDCVLTDAGSSTCSGKSFCAVWVGPDASVPPSGPSQFPAGVLRSACEAGQIDTACAGEAPLSVHYAVFNNRVSWVECVEP